MNRNLNLNWLRTFEAAAKHLSFTRASKELGLTQAAVSQQIKALESKLGQELFIRRPKSLKLTEIGKAYLPAVRDSLFTLDLSTTGLFGPDHESTITVRAPMALTVWLTSRIGGFLNQYPNVGIKFVTSIWMDTFDSEHIDVDIILAPANQTNNQLEKLSDEFLVPICGPKTSESIKSVHDLTAVQPIHILGFDDHWARYLSQFNLKHDVRSTRLQVDTFTAACELVVCEHGGAIVLERFATNAIDSGRPIKIVAERVPLNQSHYFIMREFSTNTNPVIEAFRSWLRIQFCS